MKKWLIYGCFFIIIYLLIGASFFLGLFSGIESFLEDRLFTTRIINKDIIIVAIDDESITRIGQWRLGHEQYLLK